MENAGPVTAGIELSREPRVALAAGQSAQTGNPAGLTPGGWRGFTTGASQNV